MISDEDKDLIRQLAAERHRLMSKAKVLKRTARLLREEAKREAEALEFEAQRLKREAEPLTIERIAMKFDCSTQAVVRATRGMKP